MAELTDPTPRLRAAHPRRRATCCEPERQGRLLRRRTPRPADALPAPTASRRHPRGRPREVRRRRRRAPSGDPTTTRTPTRTAWRCWAPRSTATTRADAPAAAVAASLGCGVPTAVADLHAGETVLDLGSGAGADVLISARRVGPDRQGDRHRHDRRDARRSPAPTHAQPASRTSSSSRATSRTLPLPDASVDVVISNCVINLAADKTIVLREAARVLRPGGRLADLRRHRRPRPRRRDPRRRRRVDRLHRRSPHRARVPREPRRRRARRHRDTRNAPRPRARGRRDHPRPPVLSRAQRAEDRRQILAPRSSVRCGVARETRSLLTNVNAVYDPP